MKNVDVVKSFIEGRDNNTKNLRSEDGKLYSYTSIMAEWVDGVIVVHMPIATYSSTSKRHWYYLRTNAPSNLLRRVD